MMGILSQTTEKPSRNWKPMSYQGQGAAFSHELWENDVYYASVERVDSGFFVGGGPFVRIGISSNDETARHDWRDFQRIKNDIVGDEWEAVELYPAESRLLDPSNRFYLWCVPNGVLQLGMFSGRRVDNVKAAIAPQRPFYGGRTDWRTGIDEVSR